MADLHDEDDRLLAYSLTWSAYRRNEADGAAAKRMAKRMESARSLLASTEVYDVEMPLRTLVARSRAAGGACRASP